MYLGYETAREPPQYFFSRGTIIIILDNKPALVREISREDAKRILKLLGEYRGIGQ